MRRLLLDPLRDRRFRLLFSAQAVSTLGDALVPVALAFAVIDSGGSPGDLGAALLAWALPMTLLLLVGGVWADRVPRRALIIASYSAGFTAQVVLGTLLVTGHNQLWAIALCQVVRGIGSAFYFPAASGIVPEIVDSEKLHQANALLSVTRNTTGIVGPVIAGLLVETVGPGWAILGDGASFALGAAALLFIGPLGRAAARGAGALSDLKAGWREVSSRGWVQALIYTGGVYQFSAIAAVAVLAPIVAKQQLGGASALATIFGAGAAGSVAGGVVAARWWPNRPLRAGYLGMLFSGTPGLLLLAIPAPVAVLAAAWFIGGAANAFFENAEFTVMQKKIPKASLSRVMSVNFTGSVAPRPIGLAVVGPIAATVGIRATLIAAACLALSSTACPLLLRQVREIDGEDEISPAARSPD